MERLTLEVNYAKHVCNYVDDFLQKDYEKYLEEHAAEAAAKDDMTTKIFLVDNLNYN